MDSTVQLDAVLHTRNPSTGEERQKEQMLGVTLGHIVSSSLGYVRHCLNYEVLNIAWVLRASKQFFKGFSQF